MKSFTSSDDAGRQNFLPGYDNIVSRKSLEDGIYLAELSHWEFGTGRKTQNKYTRFHFRILGSAYKGNEVYHYAMWTSEAEGYSKEYCELLGIDPRKTANDYPAIYAEIIIQKREGSKYFDIKQTRKISEDEKNRRLNKPASSDSSPTPEKDEQLTIPGAM